MAAQASYELLVKILGDSTQMSAAFDAAKKKAVESANAMVAEVEKANHAYKMGQMSVEQLVDAHRKHLVVLKEGGAAQKDIWAQEERVYALEQAAIKKVRDEAAALDAAIKKEAQDAVAAEKTVTAEMEKRGRAAAEAAKKQDEQLQRLSAGVGIGLGIFSAASGAATKSMLDQAGQMEIYRTKMVTSLKDVTLANQQLAESVEFAAKTPFEVKGVVAATVNIVRYKENVKEVLPLIGDLAAANGRDIEETSRAVTKAISGSLEGWEQLRQAYGINMPMMKAHGAAIGSQGEMLTRTTRDLETNRKVLLQIIKEDFGGGMERLSKTFTGTMSNFHDSITKATVALGEQLIPAATAGVRAITGLIDGFSNLPGPIKATIAWGTAATAGLAGIGAAAIGVISILPSFISGLQALQTLMPSLTLASVASWGAIGAAIVTATFLLQAYQGELDKAFDAQMKFEVDKTKDMALAWKAMHEWAGKSAEQLYDASVAQVDVNRAIAGMQEHLKAAKTGEQKRYYEEQIDALRRLQIELSNYAKRRQGLDGATAEAEKEAEHAVKAHGAAERDLLAAMQARLDYMRTSGKSAADEINQQEEKVAALRKKIADDDKKAADDSAKAHEDAARRKLDASLHFIDRKKTLNQMSDAEEISALQRVLRTHDLTAEQRKDISERMEDVAKKRSDDARAKKIANLEAEKKKAEEVAQKQIDEAERVKKAKIEAAEAAYQALRTKLQQELDAVVARTQGEIDEEIRLVNAKISKLKTDNIMLAATERNLRIDGKKEEADAVAKVRAANEEAMGKLAEISAKASVEKFSRAWKDGIDEVAAHYKKQMDVLDKRKGEASTEQDKAKVARQSGEFAQETASYLDTKAQEIDDDIRRLQKKKGDLTAEESARLGEMLKLKEQLKQKAAELHADAMRYFQEEVDAQKKFDADMQKRQDENAKERTRQEAEGQANAEKASDEERQKAEGRRKFSRDERRRQLESQIEGAGTPTDARGKGGLRSAIDEMYGIAGAQKQEDIAAAYKAQYGEAYKENEQYKEAAKAAEIEIRTERLKTLEEHGVALQKDYDDVSKFLNDEIALVQKASAEWQTLKAIIDDVQGRKQAAQAKSSPTTAQQRGTSLAASSGPDLGTMKTETAGPTYSGAAGPYPSVPSPKDKQVEVSANKQIEAGEKQEEAGETIFKGATSMAQAAEKLDAAGQRIADHMSALAREANYRSGQMGGISLAGGGGYFGGGGLGGVSDLERGSAGPSARGSSGGYEYGMAEKGRMVSSAELNQLKNTEGWIASGNSWTDMGNGQWWVTSGRGEPPPKKESTGFGSPIRMDVNVEHVPGAQSAFGVQNSTKGGPGFWEGRGADRQGPQMPVSSPQGGGQGGNFNFTFNVPERTDARTLASETSNLLRNSAPALGFANQIGQGQ